MGLIIARQEAERLDIETSHNKAMEFIQIHHPDYLGNGEVLGLDVGSTSRRDDRTRHASLDTIVRGSILTDSDQGKAATGWLRWIVLLPTHVHL
ncbi:hypothetical protein Pmar_PMAR014916 [Perkinsus marinus ATCC 50983]|uniref:Uncharacterized protein n=1 Tax=Perkinsus marinus (strain ATCC 50983 / TXsc) TaxID=423536 RepID=C5L594_PERM5|nr:hypothetical protein Pmar_PMAR014916 [Perkinsus marinus ATCC 50983]EER08153.1 hypothetical protein Pmar_PMAR014916 [Perkinsus marinus ATCC 50983]|eukprot:XP_002776337.1 hypothetical protein Pmar_PMAR014916 [Perkinsus marinus ATCC 50983]